MSFSLAMKANTIPRLYPISRRPRKGKATLNLRDQDSLVLTYLFDALVEHYKLGCFACPLAHKETCCEVPVPRWHRAVLDPSWSLRVRGLVYYERLR